MSGTKTGPVGIGVIGAGVISRTYLQNLSGFPDTEVLAVGDLFEDAATARAAEFGIAAAGGVGAVLDHPGVEVVVNLTIPAAHAEVAGQAISAGKHVWNEKPLSLDRASGAALLEAAESAGLRVGCAPDTFLGSGLQSVSKLLGSGLIGDPLTALILLQSPGPESWHPNPAFLFQHGAGPLFDIGPYYFTALVQQFGPVDRVSALGGKAKAVRTIGSGPKAGEQFEVTVPTHVSALVQFESGQTAQCLFSFDSAMPRTLLEINGTTATMVVPDPNTFGGDVQIRRPGKEQQIETVASTTELSSRGTGVLEMSRALREGRPHRAQGALAFHVLDIMVSISEAVESGFWTSVDSTVAVAPTLPDDWDPQAATL
ncbi:MAG TPA: Gfo/Idh/MocA family oxidoreductase [Propionibacteriaceae bacterium]|nr:Gfo/Idh/MocA family oxidoreductase [Propionibacteriaceae bacterium]